MLHSRSALSLIIPAFIPVQAYELRRTLTKSSPICLQVNMGPSTSADAHKAMACGDYGTAADILKAQLSHPGHRPPAAAADLSAAGLDLYLSLINCHFHMGNLMKVSLR